MYQQVLDERNQFIAKQFMFKILKVGQYWLNNNSFIDVKKLRPQREIDLKVAFNKMLMNAK